MEQGGSGSDQANAERRLKEAGEARSVLELFKKNLNGYVRFYEFVSQITSFDDYDMERLCVFARHLLPLLREEVLDEEQIDLSAVMLSHYHLKAKRTQDLQLRENAAGYGLDGIASLGSAKPKEEKKDFLSELLERMNDLFGTEVTEGDKLDWMQGMVTKLSENGPLMEQVRNNPRESILHGVAGIPLPSREGQSLAEPAAGSAAQRHGRDAARATISNWPVNGSQSGEKR